MQLTTKLPQYDPTIVYSMDIIVPKRLWYISMVNIILDVIISMSHHSDSMSWS